MQTTIEWRGSEKKRVRVTAITRQHVIVSDRRRERLYDIRTGEAVLQHDKSWIPRRALRALGRAAQATVVRVGIATLTRAGQGNIVWTV